MTSTQTSVLVRQSTERLAQADDRRNAASECGTSGMQTIRLMGGTIMGTEAGNSVVNSYGQTHEIPNLCVAGPGIFATSGASNPTYTIFALSLRGAEQLATDWGTVAG
jgi:choline dehydrogenase-like flavoprotein